MKTNAAPMVSIGIPCYNAEQWIAAAVQSALDQTWPNKEIIVADDGSTDGTVAVLRKFGDAIRLIAGGHRGANAARNTALAEARGEWIQYLDADDYLRVEKIERQLAEAADDAEVIYSPVLLETWREGQPLPLEAEPLDAAADLYTQFLRWQFPQTGGVLWRVETLRAIGGWDEDPVQICDEHDCYLRAMKQDARFRFAPTANAVYRIWSEATRCHSAQPKVIAKRTALSEAMRDWLKARGEWKPAHEEALGQSLLEMARKLASKDLAAAARYHAARKRQISLSGPAAPPGYRMTYKALGFRAAELIARALR